MIFGVIFRHLWFSLSKTEVFRGSGANKSITNDNFSGVLFSPPDLYFFFFLFDTKWCFFVTHRFTSVKLRFSQLEPLVPPRSRYRQHRFSQFVESFRGSRVGVVCIFEEELQGFLRKNLPCYFVIKITHFHNL